MPEGGAEAPEHAEPPEHSEHAEPPPRALLHEIAGLVDSDQEARWIIDEAGGDAAQAYWLATRRAMGEPLQHVLGHWGFRRLDVLTDGRALVPRPETEVVVHAALDELRRFPADRPIRVAELGTGSGVIACAIADEVPPDRDLLVFATDVSEEALSLAGENVRRTGAADRVWLLHGSWFEPIPPEARGSLALVVANPPYLAEAEIETLDPVVRDYDPHGALVAGPSGLEDLKLLISRSPEWLGGDGSLVLEIAPHQQDAVLHLAAEAGYAAAHVEEDLAGRPRVLVARR